MTETVFRGPVVSLGATIDTSSSPFDGPSIDYQGSMFIDPRATPANKDGQLPGAIPGFVYGNDVVTIDQIPAAQNATSIANTQTIVQSTAMTLQTACVGGSAAGTPSWTPGVPIVPNGTTVATQVYAVDFGFTTGTTTAANSAVVVVDNTLFGVGQWLVIGGAGDSSNLSCLITQVQSISTSNTTTITVSPSPAGSLSNAPIGQGNLHGSDLIPPGTQFGPASASASAAQPYRSVGFGLAFDPVQGLARGLQVAAGSLQGGTATILVSGYDVYGYAMTELITASGTTVVLGKKAFKYISNVLPTAAGSNTYAVGVADVIGVPLRADRWEELNVKFAGKQMVTAAGFTAALSSTSTNTTVDVRGTLIPSLMGGVVVTTNGTSRLTIIQTIPLAAMRSATPTASTSIFGTAQV